MKRLGGRGKHSIELLSLATVVAILVALAAMTTVVYARVAEELANKTRESIATRAMAIESAIADVYSLAADEAMNLMTLMELHASGSRDSVVEQLGTIQDGLLGCSAAWIVPEGGRPILSRGTSPAILRSRNWWQSYLKNGSSWGVGRAGALAGLGIRRNIGYIAPAFRGDTGIGTILPLVVVRYSGMERIATAFFELDLTAILDEIMNATLARSAGEALPMDFSFYDSTGTLLETSRNLPLVRVPPFRPEVPQARAIGVKGSLSDYLAPGDRSIEARWKDDRIGLVCVGRIPAREVMRDVRRVATNVLVVGALAFGSILILGGLLLQAFKRARAFEKQQLLARFEALQAKVNPHFLFNTLDSMIGVAEERDFDTLMRMLRALSFMLHASVRSTRDIVSVGEELDYVRGYLAIQEVRLRDRFSWKLEIDPAALDALVCRFSVQPLVENCFTHGVHDGCRGMRIEIRARVAGAAVEIEVEDDGQGCDPERSLVLADSFRRGRNLLGREGGLFNVHDRTRMSFGEGYGLELVDSERGFRVRLRVPAQEEG